MFDWLPDVCRELRGELLEVYWLLLVPYLAFLICLEFFNIPDGGVSAGKLIKRAVISVLLLYSFDECMNALAMISDGITGKIQGIAQLKDLLHKLWENYKSMEVSWLHAREAILYIVSLLSYLVACLGVFVAEVIVHFVWSVLYVVSPLMILMYVSDKTAFVTKNLYKGLISVVTWKVFWSILAIFLLKIATTKEVAQSDSFVLAVLLNLCIGVGMLFIPFAAKSLITGGLESAATAMATLPAAAAMGAVKLYTLKLGKMAVKEPFSGFKATRALASRIGGGVKRGSEVEGKVPQAAKTIVHRVQSYGVKDSRPRQDPFDKNGPFGKKMREQILNGKK